MRKLIYLIQGQAELIMNLMGLQERKDICVLYATYDKEIDNAFFIPNSTWGEGRNFLLRKALEIKEKFQYYIFLDDDVRFIKGSFELFEYQLLKYKPAIAVPVFVPKTKSTVIEVKLANRKPPKTLFCYQQCRRGDAQFIAFHKDVVSDYLVVPLQTRFDKISWWFTSSTQQLLILNFYSKSFIQFNNIEVANEYHREYSNNEFKKLQQKWLSNQFVKQINDPRRYAINLFSKKNFIHIFKHSKNGVLFLCLKIFCGTIWSTITYKKKENHNIQRKKIYKILKSDFEMLKQHNKPYR